MQLIEENNLPYEMCGNPACAHFIESNDAYVPGYGISEFNHLDDGEKEHDHDALPSGVVKTLREWAEIWPALFATYPDGKIGPNSKFFGK